MLFEVNGQNFDSWSVPNRVLFLGKNLKLLIVAKKSFPTVYNMPIFGVVCLKSHFSRQLVNCQFDYYLVLRVGPIETWNQETRPPSDSFQRQESNEALRISKRASVRNHVSRGKLNRLELHEFSITWHPGLCFGNRVYFWTLVNE